MVKPEQRISRRKYIFLKRIKSIDKSRWWENQVTWFLIGNRKDKVHAEEGKIQTNFENKDGHFVYF